MQRILIWDWPTRVFHILLALGFLSTTSIALFASPESSVFPVHAMIGLVLALMVLLRIGWGLVGTRYARFSSFAFPPSTVFAYFQDLAQPRPRASASATKGHNPGSAYGIFAMLGVVLGLALTGYLMARGDERLEGVHEVLAYTMVGLVIMHIVGVMIHVVRHRENIIASMLHGRKNGEPQERIPSAEPIAALLFLVVVGAWGFALFRNYAVDARTTRLPFSHRILELGDLEDGETGDAIGMGTYDGDD